MNFFYYCYESTKNIFNLGSNNREVELFFNNLENKIANSKITLSEINDEIKNNKKFFENFWSSLSTVEDYEKHKKVITTTFSIVDPTSDPLFKVMDDVIVKIFFKKDANFQEKLNIRNQITNSNCPNLFFIHYLFQHASIEEIARYLTNNSEECLNTIQTYPVLRIELNKRLESLNPAEVTHLFLPDETGYFPLNGIIHLIPSQTLTKLIEKASPEDRLLLFKPNNQGNILIHSLINYPDSLDWLAKNIRPEERSLLFERNVEGANFFEALLFEGNIESSQVFLTSCDERELGKIKENCDQKGSYFYSKIRSDFSKLEEKRQIFLFNYAEANHLENTLIQMMQNLDSKIYWQLIQPDKDGNTTLHRAILNNQQTLARAILYREENENYPNSDLLFAKNKEGYSPCHLTLDKNFHDLSIELLQAYKLPEKQKLFELTKDVKNFLDKFKYSNHFKPVLTDILLVASKESIHQAFEETMQTNSRDWLKIIINNFLQTSSIPSALTEPEFVAMIKTLFRQLLEHQVAMRQAMPLSEFGNIPPSFKEIELKQSNGTVSKYQLIERQNDILLVNKDTENQPTLALSRSLFEDDLFKMDYPYTLSQIIHFLTEGVNYVDENKLLTASSITNQPVSSDQIEWFLNQATLSEFFDKTDPSTRAILEKMVLQAFFKAAEIGRDQENPLSAKLATNYHRSTLNKLLEAVHNDYAKDIELFQEKRGYFQLDFCLLIDSPKNFLEVYQRRYSPSSDIERDTPQVFTITDEKSFEQLCDQLVDDVIKEIPPGAPILIDASVLIKDKNLTPKEFCFIEIDRLKEILNKKMKDQGKSMEVDQLIQIVGFIKHKEENLLIGKNRKDHLVGNKQPCREMLSNNGLSLSIDQSLAAWLKVKPLTEILAQNDLYLTQFVQQGSIPQVCKDWNDFCSRPQLNKLRELAKTNPDIPYLHVLPEATCLALEGLKNHSIAEAFENKQLTGLLQMYYFRMLNAMQEAIFMKDDVLAFVGQIDAVHQMIQNILAITQPYGEEDLLSAHTSELLKAKTETEDPTVPAELDIHAYHQNSAMRCYSTVLQSIHAQTSRQDLEIGFLKDTYYELKEELDHTNPYTVYTVDGDLFREKGIDEAFAYRPIKPLDAFFCEFHHNISLTRKHYQTEDITNQVKAMLHQGWLADPCTLVIDTTINLERSDDLKTLLNDPEIKKEINAGRLNIVTVRSAQKFDMLGLDNYYGGIATTIDNGKDFEKFRERMSRPEDQTQGLNRQGLLHLQLHNHKMIEAYRLKTMENIQYFYSQLPKKMIYSETNKNPLQFVNMEDKKGVFIANATPDNELLNLVYTGMLAKIGDESLSSTQRASFGFNNFNLIQIQEEVIRYNLGLEDKSKIKMCIDFLVKTQEIIDEALQKYGNSDELNQEQLDFIESEMMKRL